MNRLVQPEVRRANVLTARGGGGARAAFQALKTAATPTAFSPSKRANSSSSSSAAGVVVRNSVSSSDIDSSDHNSYLETLAVKAALTHRAIQGRAPLLDKLFLGACHNSDRDNQGTSQEGDIDKYSNNVMDLPRSKWGKPSGIVAPLLPWQADAVLARLDGNGEGLISYSEFERFALPPRGREGVRSAVARLLDVEVDPPGSVKMHVLHVVGKKRRWNRMMHLGELLLPWMAHLSFFFIVYRLQPWCAHSIRMATAQ